MRATNKYAASLSSFSTGRMWWDLHLLEHFYQTETIHTKIAFHHQITKNGRFLHAVINDLRFSPELIIKHEPVFRISATKVNVLQSIFPIHFNYFRVFCVHVFPFMFFFLCCVINGCGLHWPDAVIDNGTQDGIQPIFTISDWHQ